MFQDCNTLWQTPNEHRGLPRQQVNQAIEFQEKQRHAAAVMATFSMMQLLTLLLTTFLVDYEALSFSHLPTIATSRRPTFVQPMCFVNTPKLGPIGPLLLAMTDLDEDFVKAQDGEALQALFAKQCDSDGLMTKDALAKVPAIADLLQEGDLLQDELNDIWDAAPKFPDMEEDSNERIDVDSFIQIYRDIDDLFEEDDDDEEEEAAASSATVTEDTVSPTNAKSVADDNKDGENEDEFDSGDETVSRDEKELEQLFQTICDKDGLISRDELWQWDEVQKLLEDGLLGDDEFEDLWTQTAKSPGSSNQLDVDGFLSFNVALDELFVFDDDDDESDGILGNPEELTSATVTTEEEETDEEESLVMVMDEDLPPGVLFAALADKEVLVGMDELKRWGELQDMLAEGDLLPLELQNMYNVIPKAKNGKLNEEGFVALYNAIDELFEDDEEEAEQQESVIRDDGSSSEGAIKQQLIDLLEDINSDTERLPCGLESTELEEQKVLTIVSALETEPTNMVRQAEGIIDQTELAGAWELLYSSSSAMKFNKGLSGLGGSFPNGKFGGLVQNLQANKYLTEMEYVERIEVNPSSASFDVRVNGDWSLRGSVSLFTGEPSTIMSVVPDRVMYGPTSTRADHWKSLGPLNSLDMTYLDEDLRIMRGNTSTDTVFVFRRT